MGVLMMLLTIVGLLTAAVLVAVSLWKKWFWLRNFVLIATGIWFVFYTALLFGASFVSEEILLGIGEPKQFCGFYLDCHMHTAVSGIRKTKMLGNKTAQGEFYVVRVKVFSDARGAQLGLITVDAKVSDRAGNEFKRDELAEAELDYQPPFEQRITPTESFEKKIVFDLPADIREPRLDIREGFGIDHVIEAVLIDDEDSILHKRNFFNLETGRLIGKW